MLSFVQGQTYDSDDAVSLPALISSAKLLRAYHDASKDYLKTVCTLKQAWMFPERNPQEVICHNDFAPYNICFEKQKAIGIIDFDTAHPGPCKWDIAYALYRFAPFFQNLENNENIALLETQISRARLFCYTYGLAQNDRVGLVDLIIERLQTLLHFLIQSASQGHKKYVLNLKEGHCLKYTSDIAYIKLHKNSIQDGLI